MLEWKETKKIKVVALYEQTPKQVEPDPNPKNSLFCPKSPKNLDKIKARITGDIENICCTVERFFA